jgi:RimJ/RimL family protein N-acetyltransferase
MNWLQPVSLRGARAALEPLAAEHEGALTEAVKDGELWKLWYTHVPPPEKIGAEIERRLKLQAEGSMLPFTVIDTTSGSPNGEPVGMTTFMNVDAANRRVEIGSTWYRSNVQRSASCCC